jgi:hypothetical protein
MRTVRWMLAFVASAGCGFDVPDPGVGPDVDGGVDADPTVDAFLHEVPPRLLAGGGISDAPIGGMVNVYVVNALTRQPLEGAQVDVGAVTGTTDATGLFVARAESLQGKQTVVATKAGFRSEVWVGAQGANVTMFVRPAPMPAVPQANLSGTIPGIAAGPPAPFNHYKLGLVSYSGSDNRLDVENQIATAGGANYCGLPACGYTITTRTGTVSLLGALYDVDTKGTSAGNDDTSMLIGLGIKTGIAVVDGAAQLGHSITLLAPNQLQTVTVDLAGAPGGYTPVAVVGLEVVPREVLNLQGLFTLASPSAKAPALTVVPDSRYRLTAVLTDGQGALGAVYRRRLTTTTLEAGTWFTPPPPATADHTGASWTPPSDATISGVVFRDGNTELVSISVFDGGVAAMLPSRVVLPANGTLTVQPTAMRATFDVKDFAFDTDLAKVDGIAIGRTAPVN